MHSIIRTKKHKSITSLKSREAHTFRLRETLNANPSRKKKNQLLFGETGYADLAKSKLDDYSATHKIRKDAVIAIEYLLTASPEFFEAGPKPGRNERLKLCCDTQVEFLKSKHGAENILCMYLHLDEKTPHIEAYVLPIDPKGKLNCRHFLNGPKALADLQTAYAHANSKHGLQRGLGGSRASHTEVQQFYSMIQEKAEVSSQAVLDAVAFEQPNTKDWFNLQAYLKEQQAKIVRNVIKLFKGTVYENKLLPEAKKILRDAKRRESEATRLKSKLEDQAETIKLQASEQQRLIEQVEALQLEQRELGASYRNLLAENQQLRAKYGLEVARPTNK